MHGQQAGLKESGSKLPHSKWCTKRIYILNRSPALRRRRVAQMCAIQQQLI
jgi:hypothetical protein